MRDSVTFIHAADLHLDAPFQGVSAADETVGAALADSTYEALRRIVDLAIERSVDFVVIAGDVYNGGAPTLRGQYRFRDEAERLGEAGIPVLMVTGNHDPLDGSVRAGRLPDNVHVFSGGQTERVEVFSEEEFVCGVYGRSYQRRDEPDDFTPGYRRVKGDTVAVGVLHANVGGNSEYTSYAPCTLDGLRAGNMDYWALGHIHKPEVLSTDPYAVQVGSPQGLNPKETGEHGCAVVTVGAAGVVSFETVDLAPIAWATREMDVSAAESLDELQGLVSDACAAIRAETGRATVVRLTLTGRSSIHGMLTRPAFVADLAERIRADEMARSPWLWVDRIEDKTGPVIDLEALKASPDFLGEVTRIAEELIADDSAARELLAEVAEPVFKRLPEYEPGESPDALLRRARDRALDMLSQDGGAS